MTQPVSFTDPPMAPDAPDSLPARCPCCKGFLVGADKWGVDETYEVVEINGRDREVKALVWSTACNRCGYFVSKAVT